MFWACYIDVTRVLEGNYIGDKGFYLGFRGRLQGCYRYVARLLKGSYMAFPGTLQVCYRGVTGVLLGCYRGVTLMLQGCYRDVTEVL